MSLRKILISALAAACAVSLLVPAAYAHGGCHGRGSARQSCVTVCTVEGCELAGRHYHGATLYCGHAHANGVCNGACVSLCTVEGCELTGRHYHDGVVYCGANHSAGYCSGTCPFTQTAPSSCGGHHHGGHH